MLHYMLMYILWHMKCQLKLTLPETSSRAGMMFYRSRDPFASALWYLLDRHYNEFESVYSERYEKTYGYLRPVLGGAVGKSLKCGDLREGFA